MSGDRTGTRRDRQRLILAATLILAFACGGEGRREPGGEAATSEGTGRHVVLVLLDAARADRFSCYGYGRPTTPEVDRLAAEGMVFERHYAQGTDTRTSLPSLLASRYFALPLFPDNPQVPYSDPANLFRRPDEEQVSLPRAFAEAGFLTAAVSAHLWTGEGTAFADEFQELHDLTGRYSSQAYPYPRAGPMVDFALRWIDEHREEDVFLYLHLMDNHYPHYFEEEARTFFGAPDYPAERFRESGQPLVPGEHLTPDDLRYVDALYDGSMRYVDRHLGRLFEGLRSGDSQSPGSLVVAVTSDHGESLLDGPDGRPRPGATVFSHGGPWLEELARIPFILHAPGLLEPGRDRGLTEGVDVAPTLLSLAGVPVPEGKALDGRDLTRTPSEGAAGPARAVTPGAIRTPSWKALFATSDRELLGGAGPPPSGDLRGRLFDLREDPGETRDLAASEPERLAELARRYREALRKPYRRFRAARTTEQPDAKFAISVRHARTEPPVERASGPDLPTGWSRVTPAPGHGALVAIGEPGPLEVRFPLPDGRYLLGLGLRGRLRVRVDGEEKKIAGGERLGQFGLIEVRDRTFRATLEAVPGAPQAALLYFGFSPLGREGTTEEDEETLRRLRALGYVD